MRNNEITFNYHCEDVDCRLVYLEYECPSCQRTNQEYDKLVDKDDIYDDEGLPVECNICGAQLKIYFDKKNSDFIVTDEVYEF